MDYNQYNQTNFQPQPTPAKKFGSFSIASMICGIASLVCCCIGFSLPLGALAILFAILTRRKGQQLDSMSLSGIITGAIGCGLGLLLLIQSFAIMKDPDFQRSMYESIEGMYGEEYADIMSELYGFDLDEIKGLDIEE